MNSIIYSQLNSKLNLIISYVQAELDYVFQVELQVEVIILL